MIDALDAFDLTTSQACFALDLVVYFCDENMISPLSPLMRAM